jgi:hypothetical protein
MEPKISKLVENLEEKEELVDVFIGEGNKKINSSRNRGKKGRRKIKINECKREIHNL